MKNYVVQLSFLSQKKITKMYDLQIGSCFEAAMKQLHCLKKLQKFWNFSIGESAF